MRDPTCKEQGPIGLFSVGGIKEEGIIVKIVANVVEGHDDHDQTFEQIKRLNPLGIFGRHWLGELVSALKILFLSIKNYF